MNLIDRINKHHYLYLSELGEPEENVLRLVITEGRIGEDAESLGDERLGRLHRESRPIIADEFSSTYEILFEQYITYAVLNESFTVWDDAETFIGKLFRIYSESKFLSYVRAGTIASADYPGPFKHYGVVCLNHVVEIASIVPPVITVLPPSGA